MCFRPFVAAVLIAQSLLYLAEHFLALGAGLPLPEHHEAQAAHAAMRLGVPLRTLAEHLHCDASSPSEFSSLESHNSPALQ
jgi:hypothetical protein